jgi:hypothetical protein
MPTVELSRKGTGIIRTGHDAETIAASKINKEGCHLTEQGDDMVPLGGCLMEIVLSRNWFTNVSSGGL